MFTEEGIFSIGDGLLDVDAERLKGLLVSHDINEIYEVEQTPFARGKFAAVRRAIHKNTGLHFAAKFLKRRRRAQSSDKEIKHEIAVLMLCEGEDNIVNLNAVHETRSDTALLLELATGGELQTILDNEECLSEAQARHCMREVLKALKFLHDRSIAHLDLKPQNILLAGERIEDGLKLCDFGISRVVCEGINVREMAGTPDYVAPEVLQYEPLSLLTDIWSVGVLAYVLLSGFSPFGGDTKQETFLNISQCALTFPDNLFGGVSQAAIDFIRRALRIKPNDRMNAAGCLEHVWLKNECALDRQIYLQAQHDADFVHDDDDDDDVDDDDDDDDDNVNDNDDDEEEDDDDELEQEDIQNVKQQQHNSTTTTTTATPSPNKSTHNGHRGHSSSKIPIATSHTKLSSPSTETTTAIHTLPQTLSMSLVATTLAPKPTQIVTPTRRASDSDKENTYTATFIKKPIASTATIQIGSNGIEDATVIATLTLFPDAPTTPKVIRKTPATESSSATSVKALVKKFQLEELEANSSPNGSNSNIAHASANIPQPQLQLQQPRKATAATTATTSISNSSNMRRSISGTCSNSGGNSCNGGRRASEPLTAVHKKQNSSNTNSNSSNISPISISSSSNSKSSGSSSNATAGSSSSSSSSSGSSTALLLNGRTAHHLHHHHMHHHHHHHHHHVVKNAAAAAVTNNLSLDQGIIC